MKEIWFWISKDLAELGITIIIILIAAGCFGLWYLIDVIKRGFRKRGNRAGLYPAKRTCATCEHLAYNSDGSAECPLDWEHKCRPETQVMYKNKYE